MAPLPFLTTTIIAIAFLVVILERREGDEVDRKNSVTELELLTEKFSQRLRPFFEFLALRLNLSAMRYLSSGWVMGTVLFLIRTVPISSNISAHF
jgi:Mg2+/citrate symporter